MKIASAALICFAVALAASPQTRVQDHTVATVTEGLIGWWPADGDAIDRVGDNDGTLVGGAIFGPGRICEAFDLNGVDGYVDFGSSSLLDVEDRDFTVTLWARWRSLDGEQVLIEKWDNGHFRGWTLTKLNNDNFRFACGHNGHEAAMDAYPTGITTEQWFYVALRRSAGVATIYWDGAPLVFDTRTVCDPTPFPMLLGRRSDDRGFFHNGLLDDVRRYDRALSPEEILDLAAGTLDSDEDSVVDTEDNCMCVPNPLQEDGDSDGPGDVCDNCPAASNSDQADSDSDDAGDVCDCQPLDPAIWDIPPDILDLRLEESGSTLLTWSNQGVGVVYDIAGGTFAELFMDEGVDNAACLEEDTALTSWPDPRGNPAAAWTGYYYILRGENICGVGTYGYNYDGEERLPTGACP